MPPISQLDVIEQSSLDRLLEEGSEEKLRTFAKTSLVFLSKAPGWVRRLMVLHGQGKSDRIAAQAAMLREASVKIGANRISGICLLLEADPRGEKVAQHIEALQEELGLAERRIWQLSREMSLRVQKKK